MITFIVGYDARVTNMHMIRFFGRYADDNLLKTVEKYVAGRLIRTSLGLFQVLLIIFIMRYGA